MTKEEISNKAEEYAFRVPYNGTNDFYDNDALKHFTAGAEWAASECEKYIDILRENQQAQIAAYYNHDKTEEEKKIRNAVIEEYRDLILIFKSKFKQQKP